MKDDPKNEFAELSRLTLCNDAWLFSSNAWLATAETPNPRPVSFGSMEAMRMIGIDLIDSTSANESLVIALYAWVHCAPLADVKRIITGGTWDTLFTKLPEWSDETVAMFRVEMQRLKRHIEAVTVGVRAKPTKGGDDTPPDVISPCIMAYRITAIARESLSGVEFVAWEMPIVQALQIYHVAMWNSGRWTVRPGIAPTELELEDMLPKCLAEL